MNDSNSSPDPNVDSDSSAEYTRLREALKSLPQSRLNIPERVGEAVLAEAQRRLRNVVPLPKPGSRIGWWIPAGLAACFAVIVWLNQKPVGGPSLGDGGRLRGDVDGSGRVDMVDALVLARKLQQGATKDPSGDVNGDGVVDALDLKRVTEAAVRWDQGGGI